VEDLPAYLAHSHGTEVYHWFTLDVVTEAQAMGWDDRKNQPISSKGLGLQNTLQSLNLEWCIALPSSTAPTSTTAVDLDNITLLSFNTITQKPAAQLGVLSTAPSAVQLVLMMASVMTHDDLTVASMVNTHLSALECLCALLPQILQQLNTLAFLPSTTTGPGSTSTQSTSPSTPSMPNNTAGRRD